MKKLFKVLTLLLVFFMAAGQLNAKTIYFKNQIPDNNPWATPYVHCFGGNEGGTSWPGKVMTPVADDVWKAEINESLTTVVFNNGNQGQQTDDIMLSNEGNLFTCSNWDSGKLKGSWSTYTEPTPDPTPGPVFYLRGDINGWLNGGMNDNFKFVKKNNSYTLSLDEIYGDFKIGTSDWSISLGNNGEPLEFSKGMEIVLNGNNNVKFTTKVLSPLFTLTESDGTYKLTMTEGEVDEEIIYYIKHKWDGNNWSWKKMTTVDHIIYYCTGIYNGEGCNINTIEVDGGSIWFGNKDINFKGEVNNGDECNFVYDSENNRLSISKIPNVTYYLKHPWGGHEDENWSWKELNIVNGDGTYSLVGKYSEGAGCDYNTEAVDEGKTHVASANLVLEGEPADGDECVFTYNPFDHSIKVSKVYYIQHQWNTENDFMHIMTANGDGTYSATGMYTGGDVWWNNVNDEKSRKTAIKDVMDSKAADASLENPVPCTFTLNPKTGVVTIVSNGTITAVEDVEVAGKAVKAYKTIENGQVIIVRGEQRFNIMGQPIR